LHVRAGPAGQRALLGRVVLLGAKLADAVVLACDGFAGNRALVKEHLPHLGTPFYGGVSTSTGDAPRWPPPARRR
jgi:hypothetical protein